MNRTLYCAILIASAAPLHGLESSDNNPPKTMVPFGIWTTYSEKELEESFQAIRKAVEIGGSTQEILQRAGDAFEKHAAQLIEKSHKAQE